MELMHYHLVTACIIEKSRDGLYLICWTFFGFMIFNRFWAFSRFDSERKDRVDIFDLRFGAAVCTSTTPTAYKGTSKYASDRIINALVAWSEENDVCKSNDDRCSTFGRYAFPGKNHTSLVFEASRIQPLRKSGTFGHPDSLQCIDKMRFERKFLIVSCFAFFCFNTIKWFHVCVHE